MNEVLRIVLIRIVLILAALLYAASFVFSLKKISRAFRAAGILQTVFYIAAVVLNAGLIVYNYVINLVTNGAGYMPFVSMYQLAVFIGFMFFPARLVIEKGCGFKEFGLYASAGAAVVMTAVCFMRIDDVWQFSPPLQSPFFIPHIICYVLAYALSLAAMLIALHGFIAKKDTSGVCALCARILFPFLTCGLFMGALWADQIWGDFWAWDLKECWSLVTWLCYLTALHLYKREKLKKYANILMILGFIFVLMTFFFAKIFPNSGSMHAYN